MSSARVRRPAANVLNAVAGAQWAIQRDMLETIMSVASRSNTSPEALEAMRGEVLDNAYDVSVRDGVATLNVRGPLFRYASFFTRISGATSYEDLARDFRTCVDNPMIRAIILAIDSPGGEVNGCAEFAQMVFEARGTKPILAYVSNLGASAAYWIAAACDEIVIAKTAMLGSIGCIWGTEIVTRDDETVEEYVLVSSQSPKKNIDIRTEEGQAELMVMLDALADVFVGAVAEYRGTDVDDVLENFGQGGMFVGTAALAPGLADRLGSYEELLTELSQPSSTFAIRPTFGGRAQTPTQEVTMAKKNATATVDEGSAAAAPTATVPVTNPAPVAAAPVDPDDDEDDDEDDEDDEDAEQPAPKAKKKAAAATAALITQAKADERARVAGIRALAGPAALIDACANDPECTPAAAALQILQAQMQAGNGKGANRLAALRIDDEGAHPAAGSPVGTESQSPRDAAKASVNRFYSLTKPSTTRTA